MIYAYDDLLNDLKTRKNYFSIGQSVFRAKFSHLLKDGGIRTRSYSAGFTQESALPPTS